MWDLSSLARDWTHTPYTGRWSLNHGTTREVPIIKSLMLFSNLILKKKKSRKRKNSINLIFIKVSAHPWLSYPWSICWRSHKSTSRKALTQFPICDRSQVFIIAFESYEETWILCKTCHQDDRCSLISISPKSASSRRSENLWLDPRGRAHGWGTWFSPGERRIDEEGGLEDP